CAVIGTGYLGKFHAEKYASLPDCQLLAVVDVNPEAAHAVAAKHGAQALTDYRQLLDGSVDAVSIVVPTTLHHSVAKDFLAAGVHVLVEKPITVTVAEADDLIATAHAHNVVLQVGHLERFNPAVLGLDKDEQPLFIESHRLSPFNPRANDVSVVLDLMIHDIDIILALVNSEVERIDASGTAVLTQGTDIANARLLFKNGCVANVTASRISMKLERKMRLFRPSSYVAVDFQNRVLTKHRTGAKEMFPGIPEIETEESVFESGDALLAEIKHFVNCIQTGSVPLVSGEAGRRALATAIRITALLGEK
ncbi:MAG: Gfo/Idh/MocA family oxidoreductase, partial [Methylovulum sp.]|nr:Gfo/Idh/MocA family oxidoreductase [Methylovulum sp.]